MKDKIVSYFEQNRERMIEDIVKLVSVRSVKEEAKTGMPFGEGLAKAVECADSIAKSLGLETENFDNYVLTVNLNDKPTELGIFAHLDVVHEGTGWTTPPYEPDVRDGKVFGRGTADDKGPVVAALYAFKAVKDMGIELSKNVRLILGTDEESGSGDLPYYFKKQAPPPYSFSPDAAYPVYNIEKGRLQTGFGADFAESSALPRIVSVRGGHTINIVAQDAEAVLEGMELDEVKGYLREYEKKTGVKFSALKDGNYVKVRALGVSAHACEPGDGNNAVTAIVSMLAQMPFAHCAGFDRLKAVAEIFPHGDYKGVAAGISMGDELSGDLTISFNIFNYSVTELRGYIDSRAPICSTEENTSKVLSERMKQKGITLDTTDMIKPHHTSADSNFVKTLLKVYEEYTGMEGECVAMGGGTYVHGIPGAVAFGASYPDTDTRGHAADEFAVIDELIVSAQIFTQVIIDMCR